MDTFRNSVKHPKLVQLYDYWDSIRGERSMPTRNDMDPLDIPSLLANILLLDVECAPLRLRFRLYGTDIATIRGRDLTGHYMEEHGISRIANLTYPANEQIIETMQPHFMAAPYPLESGSGGYFYRLGLPLSDDNKNVTMIMAGFYQEPRMLTVLRETATVA